MRPAAAVALEGASDWELGSLLLWAAWSPSMIPSSSSLCCALRAAEPAACDAVLVRLDRALASSCCACEEFVTYIVECRGQCTRWTCPADNHLVRGVRQLTCLLSRLTQASGFELAVHHFDWFGPAVFACLEGEPWPEGARCSAAMSASFPENQSSRLACSLVRLCGLCRTQLKLSGYPDAWRARNA